MHIKVGTRGSRLALWQAEHVVDEIKRRYPQHTCETVVIRTKGDRIQDVSLQKLGDKGIFVKEIEARLLDGSIDMAVHSMKDMPSTIPDGLTFSRCMGREDARDVLILREKGETLLSLKPGARIGTGSMRRAVQLRALRPDIQIADIRGNLDTRLKKLEDGEYDGIVVAAAGLNRLGLSEKITSFFSMEQMVPASAQGVLAVEVREDNKELLELLNAMGDEETQQCVSCERAFMKAIDGSCHIPVGAHCVRSGKGYTVYAVYGDEDGEDFVKAVEKGEDPVLLGKRAAEKMKEEMRKRHER